MMRMCYCIWIALSIPADESPFLFETLGCRQSAQRFLLLSQHLVKPPPTDYLCWDAECELSCSVSVAAEITSLQPGFDQVLLEYVNRKNAWEKGVG